VVRSTAKGVTVSDDSLTAGSFGTLLARSDPNAQTSNRCIERSLRQIAARPSRESVPTMFLRCRRRRRRRRRRRSRSWTATVSLARVCRLRSHRLGPIGTILFKTRAGVADPIEPSK
jgi:hypothetical protein